MPRIRLWPFGSLLAAIICFPLLSGASALAQDAPAEGDADAPLTADSLLVDAGFENVRVGADGGAIRVEFENRIYRDPLVALGVVARTVAPLCQRESPLRLILLSRGIRILSIEAAAGDWIDFLDDRLGERDFRQRVRISDGSLESWKGGQRRLAPAWRKVDLAIRPLADIQLGVPDDPFQYGLAVAPEITTMPFPGVLLTLQGIIQLHEEMDPYSRPWRPGRNTLSVSGQLPGRVLATAAGGYFPGNRYGVAWEAGRFFADGQFEVRLAGDYSGFLKFSRNDIVLYSGLEAWSAALAVTHRLKGFDLVTTVTGARYIGGELGGELEVARRFREVEFSFFGIETEDDSVVGLRFTLPLPPRRWPEARRVRFTAVPDFPFEYRENSRPVALQVRLYDDLNRLRTRVNPVYLWNNLEVLKSAGAGGKEVAP